ncbi:hypothetical protein JB92DRAFT_1171495 [Gautieria morchelliformis]|nr:hypothetical protein JB92DRAFT_1171495 [Gautieria morchelliformis]
MHPQQAHLCIPLDRHSKASKLTRLLLSNTNMLGLSLIHLRATGPRYSIEWSELSLTVIVREIASRCTQ